MWIGDQIKSDTSHLKGFMVDKSLSRARARAFVFATLPLNSVKKLKRQLDKRESKSCDFKAASEKFSEFVFSSIEQSV